MKVRVDRLLIGVGALALVVGSILAWRALEPEPAEAELDRGLERLRDKPTPRRAKPRFIMPRGAFSSDSEHEEAPAGWSEPQTPREGDPGELGPDEAVDEFQGVLAELEAAVEDGRRLSEHEQAELYNRATGSFTALSALIDGSDPNERAVIDDAYGRMMSLMRQLDLEPPTHDPDYNPLRR